MCKSKLLRKKYRLEKKRIDEVLPNYIQLSMLPVTVPKKKKQILQISLHKIINPSVDKERSASIQPRSGPREFIYTYTLSHAFAPGSKIPDFRRPPIGTAGPLSSRFPKARNPRPEQCLSERKTPAGRKEKSNDHPAMIYNVMTYDIRRTFHLLL